MTKARAGAATARTPATIGVLHYDGAQLAAVHGLVDLLTVAAELHRARTNESALEVLCVEQSQGLPEPEGPLRALVLPPSLGTQPPWLTPALRAWLGVRYAQGTILCSVCVGAYLLAELGVLEGRTATTHWRAEADFAERFPNVRMDTDRLIVDDGDIITAGGLMAWVDLGLALIGRFLGPVTLLDTAREFLIDPGGREQKFYRTFLPNFTHGDQAVLRVQRWLQARVAVPTTVPQMAAEAGLTVRTLLRRFQKATGLRTSTYLQHLRVARARELLESTQKSQQEVAWEVGYEDARAFRRVFVQLLGLTPSEYRRRFGVRA